MTSERPTTPPAGQSAGKDGAPPPPARPLARRRVGALEIGLGLVVLLLGGNFLYTRMTAAPPPAPPPRVVVAAPAPAPPPPPAAEEEPPGPTTVKPIPPGEVVRSADGTPVSD
jgi:hypothetical protein